MDIAQSFGSSSSYAKKYALGNLFLLDDTKDADSNKVNEAIGKKVLSSEKFNAMLKASNEGKKDLVKSKMEDYILSDNQLKVLNTTLNNK